MARKFSKIKRIQKNPTASKSFFPQKRLQIKSRKVKVDNERKILNLFCWMVIYRKKYQSKYSWKIRIMTTAKIIAGTRGRELFAMRCLRK